MYLSVVTIGALTQIYAATAMNASKKWSFLAPMLLVDFHGFYSTPKEGEYFECYCLKVLYNAYSLAGGVPLRHVRGYDVIDNHGGRRGFSVSPLTQIQKVLSEFFTQDFSVEVELLADGWVINVVVSLALFILGAALMLADTKLGTGLVSLMGVACTLIAVVALIPIEVPPENQGFVMIVKSIMIACGVVATGFFVFVSYKVYEAKRLRKKVDISALIGEVGVAKTPLNPRGVINVKGELWSAVVEGGGRVEEGEEVIVTGYSGLTLKVKPLKEEKSPYKWGQSNP